MNEERISPASMFVRESVAYERTAKSAVSSSLPYMNNLLPSALVAGKSSPPSPVSCTIPRNRTREPFAGSLPTVERDVRLGTCAQ